MATDPLHAESNQKTNCIPQCWKHYQLAFIRSTYFSRALHDAFPVTNTLQDMSAEHANASET